MYAPPTISGIFVSPPAPAGPVPARISAAYERRVVQRDHLRDTAADRKAEQVDLLVSERANERGCVGGHLVEIGGRLATGRADATVVEDDHVSFCGDAVDHARVPVVEHRGEVVQEHQRDIAAWAELPVGERCAADVDRLRLHRLRGGCVSGVLSHAVAPFRDRSFLPRASLRRWVGRKAVGPRSPRCAPCMRASPAARRGWRASR